MQKYGVIAAFFDIFARKIETTMLRPILTVMPMLVCCFWLALFLLGFRKANGAKRIMTFFLLTASALYFSHCVYFNFAYRLIPVTDTLYQFATLSVYPLYLLYIRQLTDTKPFGIKDFLVLLPGVLVAASVGILYLMMTGEERNGFIRGGLYRSPGFVLSPFAEIQRVLHKVTSAVFALQLIPILCLGIKKIQGFEKKIESYYSYTDNKSLNNTKTLLLLFVSTSILSFVANLMGKSFFVDSAFTLFFPSMLFSLLLFALSYVAYQYKYSAKEFEEMFQLFEEIAPQTHFNGLKARIIQLMEKDRYYLQQDLKLSDLAVKLGTNRNYIYNAINLDMGVSFSEFVNRYRVEYAKQLLLNNPNISVSEICFESGFSSEATFYRNFRLFTGTTPIRWMKKQDPQPMTSPD